MTINRVKILINPILGIEIPVLFSKTTVETEKGSYTISTHTVRSNRIIEYLTCLVPEVKYENNVRRGMVATACRDSERAKENHKNVLNNLVYLHCPELLLN